MLKDSEISRYSTRRTHRTYKPEFKSQLVAACQQPGASVAALAVQHGMNANVLHRWLKEHQHNGRHQLTGMPAIATSPSRTPSFIPLALPAAPAVAKGQEVKVELRKGSLSMVVTWPLNAAADLTAWTIEVLK